MKTIATTFGLLFHNAATPEQARSALARVRVWRRRLLWTLAILAPVLLAAITLPDHNITPAPLFVLIAAGGLAYGLLYDAESRHLAVSVTDVSLPDAAPMTLTWRHGFATRAAVIGVITAAVCAYLVMMWTHHRLLAFDIPITLVYAWLLYEGLIRTAWRPLSRASHVADLDAAGLRVLPLDVTVRWDQISGVFLTPGRIRWALADPAAFVAAQPDRRGHQRALGRWLKAHKGGIDISDRQIREAPIRVHAMSVRLRYEATGAGAAPGSGVM